MAKIIRFTTLIILFLSFAFQVPAEQTKIDNDKANTAVLEERIKGDSEKTQTQIRALDEKVDFKHDTLKDEVELRTEELQKRMNLYLAIVVALFAIIGFLGFKTITNWIKQTIEDKTVEVIKEENIAELISERGVKAIKELIDKIEVESKEKIDNLLNSLKKEAIDISKPLPKETVKKLDEFEETLERTKKVITYTFDDWFYKGLAEYEKKDYPEAIKSWTKMIELNPKNATAYFSRGAAYVHYKQLEEAIKDFSKSIELDPKNAVLYNNRGITYNKLKQHEKAIEDLNKAVELNPKYISAYLNLSETYIITGSYETALDTIKKVLPLSAEIKDKAIYIFLACIAKKLLNMDTSKTEAELDEISKKEFTTTWVFDEIETWLKEADISEETKKFIFDKIELLKKHK
jgi:tetratricopeptide (TPR) repeat protein